MFGLFDSLTLASLTSRKETLDATQARLNACYVEHRDDINEAVLARDAFIATIQAEIAALQEL